MHDDVMLPKFRLGDLTFGGYEDVRVADFDPGPSEVRVQDAEVPLNDGLMMGRDFFGPGNWTWELFTDFDSPEPAIEAAERTARTWRNDRRRRVPGAVEALSYRIGGRWRRVYGRPRRFVAHNGGVEMLGGNALMTADFQRADHLHYDEQEQSIEVGVVRASTGGFIFPVTFPISTIRQEEFARAGQFEVGGSAPAWPVIEIAGPVANPDIRIGDWRLRLTGSIAYDRIVTVDTRPWARSVTRSDGANVPGMLHHTARFSELGLEPGYHEVVMRGDDLTGTARTTVRWRNAYYSI